MRRHKKTNTPRNLTLSAAAPPVRPSLSSDDIVAFIVSHLICTRALSRAARIDSLRGVGNVPMSARVGRER